MNFDDDNKSKYKCQFNSNGGDNGDYCDICSKLNGN